jgi:hypothetical protein
LLSDKEWFLEYTRQMYNTKAISVGGIFRDYFRQLEEEPEDLIGEDGDVGVNEGHLLFSWRKGDKRYRLLE